MVCEHRVSVCYIDLLERRLPTPTVYGPLQTRAHHNWTSMPPNTPCRTSDRRSTEETGTKTQKTQCAAIACNTIAYTANVLSRLFVFVASYSQSLGVCFVTAAARITFETKRRARTAHSNPQVRLSAPADAGVGSHILDKARRRITTMRCSKHI